MANASKKTDEEEIAETFQNFDPDSQTKTGDEATGAGNGGSVKKSGKSNTALFIVAGIATVGILGYVFVAKPMFQQSQMTQVAANNTNNNQPTVQNPSPVAQTNNPIDQSLINNQQVSQPEVAANNNQQIAPTVDPLAQLNLNNAAPIAPVQNPNPVVQPDPLVQLQEQQQLAQQSAQQEAMNQQAQANQMGVVEQNNNTANPVTPTPNANANPVIANNGGTLINSQSPTSPQEVVITDLESKFTNQNSELKGLINGIGSRVDVLEGKYDEVSKRIVALEEGKVDKKKPSSNNNVTNNSEKAEPSSKPVRRPVVKKAAPKQDVKRNTESGDDVLFKTSGSSSSAATPSQSASKPSLAPLEIHSIYGQRIWTKNANGTLSTYAEGDKLPTGEVIKSINDETFTVVTNQRKIVKK
jgi:hypothetical protein